ncbi:MAG: DUF1579 domain-containing protein [bacterium]|nr:DUF1579 domain-containing protein [bacterium]
MRKNTIVWIALITAALVALPAPAMTLDEVVAKYREARGGEAWDSVQSMKVSGTFTAFSKVAPFTAHRKRDNKFHIDHVLDGKRIVIGYDDELAWWDNEWRQDGAQPVTDIDLGVVLRRADFLPPLMNYDERGFTAELIGETEIDGIPAIGIKLVRPDESEETWYLSPKTYLEIGADSPGSDFGNAMPQRTFFDDFREVKGVMIPHYVESQWYTRDRVMDIEEIAFNVEIDDEMFKMPLPDGMAELQPMIGKWNVKAAQRQQPGAPWQESERTSEIESRIGNGLLHETYTTANGTNVFITLSYDRHREQYRMTEFNDQAMFLDVLQGTFGDDGRLVLSNMDTGTPMKIMGMTIHSRLALFDIGPGGFKLEHEVTIDGGQNWFVAGKADYTRADDTN